MNKSILSIAALIIAVVLFLAINIVGGNAFRGARVDLTEGSLYTLSDGSRNIARKLPEPIRLTLYFSEKIANDVPSFKSYATRVKEMLTEYARSSGGKIDLAIVNPEPFSDTEDKAVAAGLVGVPTGRGSDRFYFGLVGVNSTDKQQVIPFFDPQKEGFLEYDITHMVYLLSDAPKKVVGVMTWLPLEGMPMNPMGGRGVPPWQIIEQMKELFEVKSVENAVKSIPADIGVLMVVHPKGISPETQYAIDQFVLRGGRLLLFVDPHCEKDLPPGMNPMQAMQVPKASDLPTLLNAWGVEMVPGKIAGDRDNAIAINAGAQNRPEPVPYIGYLRLDKKEVNATDPITGNLANIIIATAGVLKAKDGAATTFEPLIHTSKNSMMFDASSISFVPDFKGLLAKFESGGQELVLAGRITGRVKSAFPEGAPTKPGDEAGAAAATAAHLAESNDSINVVVVADCDMIADDFWIREQKLFGQVSLGYSKVSDNGDFAIGSLDNLGGSSDLMSLRARGGFARPFERVQQIQRDAEDKFLKKEQELQTRLRETEQKINELQQKRPDGQATALLTPEQQKQVDDFTKERIQTRKDLRDVQHQLRKDIEGLGTRLKAINIAAMPIVVGLVALGLSAYRLGRRKTDRMKSGARS